MSQYDTRDMGTYRVRRLKIVIPFVDGGLADETKAWGEEHRAEFVDLTGDDEGYFRLVTRLWSEGSEFTLVEQDMLPAAEQFAEMTACPREWCAGTHRLNTAPATEQWNMGLMKFGTALLQRRFGGLVDGGTAPDAQRV